MQTITKTYNIYTFKELSKEAQEKAICDYINFVIDMTSDEVIEDLPDLLNNKIRVLNIYLGEIIYETGKDQIIDDIKKNEYRFFENGEIIPPDFYSELR